MKYVGIDYHKPIIKGHTLVIPRQHLDNLYQAPPALLGKLMAAAQKVAQAQVAGLKADGVNIHQSNGASAGQVVPHLHFHVIPRFANDGHRWNWAAKKYDSIEEIQKTATAIRGAIS